MRRLLPLAFVAAGALLAAGAGVVWLAVPDPGPLLARTPEPSVEIVDRHGGLLRALPAKDGTRHRPVEIALVSPHLLHAVLAAEDRRFHEHHGVDPLALARAAST